MPRIVDGMHTYEAVCAEVEACDAAIGGGDPDGAQFGGVERAHEVQCENADRAGVGEDGDGCASVSFDGLVQFARGAVEQLAVAFAAVKDVLEVSAEQRGVLFGVLLGGFLEGQALHHSDAAFAESVRQLDLQSGQAGQGLSRFDGALKVARIDGAEVFRGQRTRGGRRLRPPALRERRRRVTAKAARRVALRLSVAYEQDARSIHKTVTSDE